MAVVYEDIGGGKVKAYSDAGKMIHGGFPEGDYAVAFDPAAAGRTYTETEQFVPTEETSPVKAYDVYKLILALKSLDVTVDGQTVKAIVPAVEWIKAHGLYEEFLTIRSIRADDEDLMGAISALAVELGVPQAAVDAILAAAEEG